MWKSSRKEEERTPASGLFPAGSAAPPAASPSAAAASAQPVVQPKMEVSSKMADIAHIGKSVIIRGELSGSEDLYLDGEVEGSIDLNGHSLTIGPNGRIRANIHAHEVVVHGRVDGNIRAAERVELKKSAVLAGDIFTQRIMIEDGAYFKGAVDIQKAEVKPEPKPEPKKDTAIAASASTPAHTNPSPGFTPAGQAPVMETK